MADCEMHPFDRSGLAALSDLRDPRYKQLFAELEKQQERFLSYERSFRSADYLWPRDALHWWSRVWEYPYAYHHLQQFRPKADGRGQRPAVVDVGTGVTFFPFALAGLGYDLICTDVDPVCQRDLAEAAKHIPRGLGSVSSLLIEDSRLPVDDGAIDAVCCISVLEHIPAFEVTIREMARVLRPGGLLVLTIDLDLNGNSEIGPQRYGTLLTALHQKFALAFDDVTVHPMDALYSSRGPHPMIAPGSDAPAWKKLARRLLKRPQPAPTHLAVQGLVMTRLS